MRKVALFLVLALAGCGESSGTSVLVPNVMSSRIEGVPASQRFQATLSVRCADQALTATSQFDGTATQIVFADLPPCGDAAMTLEISALYDSEDPVLAFQSSSNGTLRTGKTSSVDFSGPLLGELVLDPVDLGASALCFITTRTDSITVDLTPGAISTRLPRGSYPVHCVIGTDAFDVVVDVTAGARDVTPVTLETLPTGALPTITAINNVNPTAFSVTVLLGITGTNPSVYAELFLDADLTQPTGTPSTTADSSVTVYGLNPQTSYWLRLTPRDDNGDGVPRVVSFTTTADDVTANLATLTFDGATPSGFAPGGSGGYVVLSYAQRTGVSVAATTQTATTEISFDNVTWTAGSASYLFGSGAAPIPPNVSTFTVHTRTADRGHASDIIVNVYRDPG